MAEESSDSIRVLHVDEDPDFVALAATVLERVNDRLTVETETSVSEALATLDGGSFDCVVADYDMPGRTGILQLGSVRDRPTDTDRRPR